MAKGICYKRRDTIGRVDTPQPIPPGVGSLAEHEEQAE